MKRLFESLCSDTPPQQIEELMQVAWTIWNAVVLADSGKDPHMLNEVCRNAHACDPTLAAFLDELIDRKRRHLGDDLRLIGEYQLIRSGNEIRLRAVARVAR